MKWKQTIIFTALANALLLTILFLSAVTNKETIIATNQTFQEREDLLKTDNLPFEKALFENENISSSKIAKKEEPIKEKVLLEVAKQKTEKPVDTISLQNDQKKETSITYKLPSSQKKEIVEDSLQKIYVKRGDNLEKIAKRFKTKASDISSINNISGNFLRIGQELLIPTNKTTMQNNNENIFVVEKAKELDEKQYYKVKSGDNPWTIAMKHHIKVNDLLKLNNLTKEKARRLRPGNKLRIR